MAGLLDYLAQLGQSWGLGQDSADRARRDAARRVIGSHEGALAVDEAAIARWKKENETRRARGEKQDSLGMHAQDEMIIDAMGGFEQGAVEDFREGVQARTRGMGRENMEDRTHEVTLPHWVDTVMMKYGGKDIYGNPRTGPDWLPREVIPEEWSEGHAARLKKDPRQAANLNQGRRAGEVDEFGDPLRARGDEYEWRELRDDDNLIDDEFEPTDSPLVLRKRNANGTVTYVHALTGQPLFDDGLYGMNDPQGAERERRWDDVFDPYWREGRRDW